jgi:branched-chain amino acid transport system permease protein
MAGLLQQIVSGVATGSIYACLGLALVMIYQSTHRINFAQGEMAMFSTYIAWALLSWGLSYWVAFVLTIVISFVGGFLIERIVLRPLGRAPVLSSVVVFVGLLVIFNSVAGWIFNYNLKQFPSPFPDTRPFGSTLISFHELGMMGVTLAIVMLLYLFMQFTSIGLAMRAAAQNPASSRLSGIPVSLMLSIGWGLAAAIGATAGMMIAPIVFLDPNMMSGVFLYGAAAALLGGIDSPWGAVIGGLLIGIVENLVGAYVVGTELKLSVALLAIIGVLLVRPSGLFGKRVVVRV